MSKTGTRAACMVLAVIFCASCLPASDSADADYAGGEYGAVFGTDINEIDQLIKDTTGKTIKELVKELSDSMENYELEIDPGLFAKFALKRDTTVDDSAMTISDAFSGYLETTIAADMEGKFPEPGTYYPQEGESGWDFIVRVFSNGSTESRAVNATVVLGIYAELLLTSHVDTSTGKLTSVDVSLKLSVLSDEMSGISLDLKSDGDDNPVSLTVTYSEYTAESDFFLSFGAKASFDDMTVLSSEDEWTVEPTVTVHMDRLLVSSDLADSMWAKVLKAVGGGAISSQLPDLLLKVLRSGGRTMDIFETISSLTGSSIPDMVFDLPLSAAKQTDSEGRESVAFTFAGDENAKVYFSTNAFVLNLTGLIYLIPESMISAVEKLVLDLVFIALGWDDTPVDDVSGDEAKKEEIAVTQEVVSERMTEEEKENYPVPSHYIGIAAVGIAISVILPLLMWRRVI